MRRLVAASLLMLILLRADMYQDMSNVANPVVSGIRSQIPGILMADSNSWDVSTNGFAASLDQPAGGNRFVMAIQGTAQTATTTGSSYERGGLIVQVATMDAASDGRDKDMVGIDTRGKILAGVNGRAWGLYSLGQVSAGADGYALAAELSLENLATVDQPLLDYPTSKYLLHMVASGTQNVTAGIVISSAAGAARLHCGICIKQDAIATAPNDRAIWLGTPGGAENFGVTRDGDVIAAGAVKAAVLGVSAPQAWANNHACVAGQIMVDASFIYVCTAANVVKRAALAAF